MRAYVIIGAALTLTITPAIAGGKNGGGHATAQDHPQENISLSYGKTEHTYASQKVPRDAASGKATGKRSYNPNMTITTPK
jgi:hypothetical protein